ncbi:YcxB family protein [Marivirga sp. S37H4]|uniref:YcxB family protein n=1 Tax=Marivirga aurantiaca TaxID=2802615 RepID=A0A935CBZ0_9BACT|nr:YcxB family protein [Marivirga aurantiaca]
MRHIKEHMSGSIDKLTTLEFQEDFVYGIDETNSESKINYSTIESFNELPQHFLLRLKGGQALILPKHKIVEKEQLRSEILEVTKKLGVELKNYTNWKWRGSLK